MSREDSEAAELMRLVEEDRAESAPPQREDEEMKPVKVIERHPALVLLMAECWDDAFGMMLARSASLIGAVRSQALLDAVHDRADVKDVILGTIERLYAIGTPASGAMAVAWQMLACDPRWPLTFAIVLPQLQHVLDTADLPANDDADLRQRLRVWWRAAEAEFRTAKASIFRLADPEAECWPDPDFTLKQHPISKAMTPVVDPGTPTLVVMPAARASKLNNYNAHYKPLIDAALPLVVVRDVHKIRKALHREFPHAVAAVDVLIRDLRDGQPFHVKPACLMGSSGSGKSRLVRRMSALVSERLWVHRFDGAVSDGQFSGTAKGWANTEPSVPVRAVWQSMTANPIVMVDEADKSKESQNGFLAHSLLQFTDPEGSSRVRDQSLDAELDLSLVTYILTANEAKLLPGMLRDRFRLIRMPTPTLQHLSALAAQVMEDLARDDEARVGDAPLAADELAGMGRAWAGAGFSMRKLKAIVRATLEARDSCAWRH